MPTFKRPPCVQKVIDEYEKELATIKTSSTSTTTTSTTTSTTTTTTSTTSSEYLPAANSQKSSACKESYVVQSFLITVAFLLHQIQ